MANSIGDERAKREIDKLKELILDEHEERKAAREAADQDTA